MDDGLVTVAVVPRERFSMAERSLESILSETDPRVPLVYVDGGSPAPIREYLARRAAEGSFQLLRTENYLVPNMARNLAAAQIRSKYIVFIDNDAIVSPNWLAPLVDCAEATGAWVVGPVYCEREPIATRIHMAGGSAKILTDNGRRVFEEEHRFYGKMLKQIGPNLHREPVEQIEFHCVLVRTEVFDRLGPLDEQLMSAAEHTDLCLLTRKHGGEVYLEPKSVVTYLPPPPFAAFDLDYFQLRWSHAWNESTIKRFREKWDLAADDPGLVSLSRWLAGHRRLALEPYRRVLRLFGRKPAKLMEKLVLAPWEQASNARRYPIENPACAAARLRSAA